jgi:hypothetical protein
LIDYENIAAAAEKSKAQSLRKQSPTDIFVGSICQLISPGDLRQKRNILKPRHDDLNDGPLYFLFRQRFTKCQLGQLGRGHSGVEVRVDQIIKATAAVTYLTPGWRDEAIGTQGKVEILRLKRIVKSTIHFSIPSKFLSDAIREGRTLKVSKLLSDSFFIAWCEISQLSSVFLTLT